LTPTPTSSNSGCVSTSASTSLPTTPVPQTTIRFTRAPSDGQQDGRAVAEQALVGGDPDAGAFHLATGGLAAQLPGDLADLGQRLGRDGLAEAGEPAARVDRHPP